MTDTKRRRKASSKRAASAGLVNAIPKIDLDVTKLPSRGVPYPKGAQVSYRTYTFGEIRKASTSSVSTKAALKLALSGTTASFGARNLTLMDALYIGILRKVSSLNSMKFEVPFVCTKCKSQSKGIFTHENIEFKDLSDEVTQLPLVTEINGRELHFGCMTAGDYLSLANGTYDAILKEGKIDRVASLAITIRNMNFAEAYEFLYGITDLDDVEVLTEVDKLLSHSLKPLAVACLNKIDGEQCGGINHVKLEGREVLLTPFRESEGSARARIRFGTAPKPESVPD